MSIDPSLASPVRDLPPATLGNLVVLVFLAAHSLLLLVARHPPASRKRMWLTNLALGSLFGSLLLSGWILPQAAWVEIIRLWAPLVFFWWAYRWMDGLLHLFHRPGSTFDALLLRLDQLWFRQPSLWLARGGRPWITEALHAAYSSYYLYTPFLGVALARAGHPIQLEAFLLAVISGYAFCYLLYPIFPVWGPRWSLVEQGSLGVEEQQLDGYWLTRILNHIMYQGVALKGGAMPSAHASTGLVFLVWCHRLWGATGGVSAAILVVAMMMGAVYGRYHYVWDLIAGIAVGVGSLWLADRWLIL